MASYSVNEGAVAHARRLIQARQYVLDSDWGDVQPSADEENAFSDSIPGRSTATGRAAEWRHKQIELTAHELLQLLDKTSA